MNNEVWKQLDEFNGYELSSLGRVRNSQGKLIIVANNNLRVGDREARKSVNMGLLMDKYYPVKKIEYLEDEKWKDVVGYEGLYQVSNYGRVKTVPHKIVRSNGWDHYVKETLLTVHFRGKKDKVYNAARLYKDGKVTSHSNHRLVAQAFMPNPFNFPVVNHKDGDKLNNHISNLEWCTVKFNVFHAVTYLDSREPQKRPVIIQKLDGTIVKEASSVSEAARFMNGNRVSVRFACIGKINSYKGYKFAYA